MIKISLFMLDPIKAHELYVKEVEILKQKLALAEQSAELAKKEQKVMYKTMKEKVRQMGCQIAGLSE